MSVIINGSAGVTTNSGAVYNGIQGGTAVTASGTSVDFTSIPSWVKRITVMFNGVSTNGTSNILVQIGNGSVISTGYTCSAWTANATNTTSTAGFLATASNLAATTIDGILVIGTLDAATFKYTYSSNTAFSNGSNAVSTCAGGKTLAGTLDRIRITTVNGTDTFDAGSINILYE
jgi:hypothetical protein